MIRWWGVEEGEIATRYIRSLGGRTDDTYEHFSCPPHRIQSACSACLLCRSSGSTAAYPRLLIHWLLDYINHACSRPANRSLPTPLVIDQLKNREIENPLRRQIPMQHRAPVHATEELTQTLESRSGHALELAYFQELSFCSPHRKSSPPLPSC